MLKDILASIKEPGTVNIKKDLDLWLVKDYQDLGSYGRGKTGNLHPSSISGCPRAEVYKRIGVPEVEVWPFTGKTQRIFDNGTSMSRFKPSNLIGRELVDIATDEEYLILKFRGGLTFYIKSKVDNNPILTAFIEEEEEENEE